MTRLVDADALLEAIGKNSNIAYHKNIVNQCEVYIKKYQSMTGFGYEVDQANKRLRLHNKYIDEVLDLITNAPTVQREGWVSVPIEPTEEMIEAGRVQGKNNELEFRHRDDGAKLIYQSMISAAPKE